LLHEEPATLAVVAQITGGKQPKPDEEEERRIRLFRVDCGNHREALMKIQQVPVGAAIVSFWLASPDIISMPVD
jgi:hypothetical protein